MSEKVVLPKFDLPGTGPHPAVRALWIVGGLLGVALLGLGGAMWRHHAAQETAALEKKAEADRAIAEAAASEAAAKAKLEADAVAAKAAKSKGTATSPAAPGAATGAATAVATTDSKHKSTSGSHHHAAAKAGKATAKGSVLAKSETHGKAAPLSKKKGDDAIDKLLASFK